MSRFARPLSSFLLVLICTQALAPWAPLAFAEETESTKSVEVSEEATELSKASTSTSSASSSTSSASATYTTEDSTDRDVQDKSYQTQKDHHDESWTGAFNYSYPFSLPQGRKGLTPALALSYDSQSTRGNGIVANGWSLNIPSITHLQKNGVDTLYSDPTFSSSLSGEFVATALSSGNYGSYGAKTESGDFYSYTYNSDGSWTLVDKNGTVYSFGASSASRQSDPTDSTVIHTWMLEEVRDSNDNTISYTYTTDGGQIYPESINYTGNGSSAGAFTVNFSLETIAYPTVSYAKGFEETTEYRISSVDVEFDGDILQHYDLDVDTGDMNLKDLLSSITQTAYSSDGTAKVLPATEFEYSAMQDVASEGTYWVEDTAMGTPAQSFVYDSDIYHWTYSDFYVVDINADGLDDQIYSVDLGGGSITSSIYLNQGNGKGWKADTSGDFELPVGFVTSAGKELGVRVADVNGDALPDFIKNFNDGTTRVSGFKANGVYINQGVGAGWALDSLYTLPTLVFAQSSSMAVYTNSNLEFADVNGDGFADLVTSQRYSSGSIGSYVEINKADGTGWKMDTSYKLPVGIENQSGTSGWTYGGVRMFDVNGDGLADLIKSVEGQDKNSVLIYGYETYVYNGIFLNTGEKTWKRDTSLDDSSGYTGYQWTFLGTGASAFPKHYTDVNGDNLFDVAIGTVDGTGKIQSNSIEINPGENGNWKKHQEVSGALPVGMNHESYGYMDTGVRFGDMDGDGMQDIIKGLQTERDANNAYYINQNDPVDRLIKIDHSGGASTSVTYKNSPEYMDGSGNQLNPDLYTPVQTVSSITVDDGIGTESTVSYEYSGGEYYYASEDDRQFAGFESITKTEAERSIVTHYHQDTPAKIGKAYQVDIYDGSSDLLQRQITVWDSTDLGDGNTYIFATDSVQMDYDSSGAHRDKATSYEYTAEGNIQKITQYGEVSAATDGSFTDLSALDEKFIQSFEYATDSAGLILNKMYEEKISNDSGTTLKKTNYFYDGATLKSVSKGNVTQVAQWDSTVSAWNETLYQYNSYGLPTSSKNPRGYTTRYSYDSYNLYPSTITNPKGFTVTLSYDYGSGQIATKTDENSFTSQSSYDGLGRPLKLSLPDPSTGTLSTLMEWAYDDSSMPHSVTQSSTIGSVTRETVTYLDALGRTLESNTLAEDGFYNTTDYWYDEMGNLTQQSLPYQSSSSVYGRTSSADSVTTTYDALNRPLSVTAPTGSTSYSYGLWDAKVTDPNLLEKDYDYDSAGHLIGVDEHDGSSIYSTVYTYDALGQLTDLTDAQGNTREFSYDSLGRKTKQTELHTPSETSYGSWTYSYDLNSNLLTQTDPASQVITWGYDDLDRVSYEDWDRSTPVREIVYDYDSASNGKMQISKVQMADYKLEMNSYDAQGHVTKETKTIKNGPSATGQIFPFQYSYDLAGQLSTITYPASALTVNYTYNELGAIEKITTGSSTLSDLVLDMDYTPAGQVSSTAYANGTVTTNTYDPSESYRLTHKTTTGSYLGVTGNIQDLDYAYDPNGNITSIVDASVTPTAKSIQYTYDDLNRLLSASTSGLAAGDYSESYTYDSVGNLTHKSDIGDLLYTGTGASGTNPHAVTSVAGTAYTYDPLGNLTSDGAHTYTWDKRNRLKSSTGKVFSYDHTGQRFRTKDSSTGTNVYSYYPSPYEEVREGTDTSLGKITLYVYAGSTRVASFNGGQATYYHQDHLGGVSATTNLSGAVSQLYDYYPYGSELSNTQLGSTDSAHSFTDKELDDSLGLYYFEARWYNPSIGRFAGRDPAQMDGRLASQLIANPQALNHYSYSGNNPINYVDPTREYQKKTGVIEAGDTKDGIVKTVEEEFGIETSWEELAEISFINPDDSIEELVEQNEFLAVGTNYVADVTNYLTNLNEERADEAAANDYGIKELKKLFCNQCAWDLKNSNDSFFGRNRKFRAYIFYGSFIRYDAPGNIQYGYVMHNSDYSWFTTSLGAQYASIKSNGSFDSAYDQKMINYGYNLILSN